MIHILDTYPQIASVRLSKGPLSAGKKRVHEYSCKYITAKDVGRFKLCPRLSLNPTLFKGKFVKEAVEVMTTELNPESQLVVGHARKKQNRKGVDYNADAIEEMLSKWDNAVLVVNGGRPVIEDIGTRWRRTHRFSRGYDFINWHKGGKNR